MIDLNTIWAQKAERGEEGKKEEENAEELRPVNVSLCSLVRDLVVV